jgi:hypothetical protein
MVRAVSLAILASTAVAHADASTSQDIAHALIDAQLAAVNDPTAFARLLAPNAVILGNGSFAVAGDSAAQDVLATLGGSPSGLPARWHTVHHFEANGSDRAVWVSADITLYQRGRLGKLSPLWTNVHLIELVVARGAHWQVVALGFASTSGATAQGDVMGAPGSGPLTPLVLESWRDRDPRLVGAVEASDAGWGFVAAELTVDEHRVAVLAFALPDERGRWEIASQLTAQP